MTGSAMILLWHARIDPRSILGVVVVVSLAYFVGGPCHARSTSSPSAREDSLRIAQRIEQLLDPGSSILPDSALIEARTLRRDAEQAGLRNMTARVIRAQGVLLLRARRLPEAQEHFQEALLRATTLNDPDTRSRCLVNLGQLHHQRSEWDQAAAHFRQGLAIADSLGDRANSAAILNLLANLMADRGALVDALTNYEASLALRKALNDTLGTSEVLGNMAIVLMDMGAHERAIPLTIEALRLAEARNDQVNIARNHSLLADLHSTQGAYDLAAAEEERSLAIRRTLGDPARIIMSLNNLAGYRISDGDTTQGMRIYEEGLALAIEHGLEIREAQLRRNLALRLFEMNRLTEAQDQLVRAMTIRERNGDRIGLAYAKQTLARVRAAQLRHAEAIDLAQDALAVGQEVGDVDITRYAAQVLHQVFARMGRHDQALEMFELHVRLRDSVNSASSQRALVQQSMRYEFSKRENDLLAEQEKRDAVAREQLDRKAFQRDLSFVGIGLLALVTGIILAQRDRIRRERDRSDGLLLNILPAETAHELKEKGYAEARLFEDVTVLFTDFKGFTRIAEQLGPADLVAEIHVCFSEFDRIMERYGVEKIKTIGDAYMAAGGLPVPNRTHPADVVQAGLDMCAFMAQRNASPSVKARFEIRVGVHTGPVVAGIVGIKKFQYDIWGDTVNIAARLESSGAVGQVNLSAVTRDRLDERFRCIPRGTVEAKGKGPLPMWFVERNDTGDHPSWELGG